MDILCWYAAYMQYNGVYSFGEGVKAWFKSHPCNLFVDRTDASPAGLWSGQKSGLLVFILKPLTLSRGLFETEGNVAFGDFLGWFWQDGFWEFNDALVVQWPSREVPRHALIAIRLCGLLHPLG